MKPFILSMSIHVKSTPEAEARLVAQKRNTSITAVMIALLISALIISILWLISISGLLKNTNELVTYSAANVSADKPVKPEMTNQVMKKPSSPSSSMSKVITSSTPSPTAIPVPDIVTAEPSIDFGSGDDFGDGWGNGNGNGSKAGGKNTPFGRIGGDGMKGAFYDLKQTSKRTTSTLGKSYEKKLGGSRSAIYKDEIKSLQRGRYSESRLSKYYKADLELIFSHMVMPITSADSAPKAFGVEKEVLPAGWLIVYQGKLAQTPTNKIKFTGRYDDLLIVYVNNKIVFDGSWTDHSGEFDKGEDVPRPSLVHPLMRKAPEFISLHEGDDILIVIGESPGGRVGGGLFVEEEGKTYKKNEGGANILPPFCAEALDRDDIKKLKKIKYPMELNDVPVFTIN